MCPHCSCCTCNLHFLCFTYYQTEEHKTNLLLLNNITVKDWKMNEINRILTVWSWFTYLQVLFEVMWWRMWPWASCRICSLGWHIGLGAWPLTRTTHHIGRGSLVHCRTSPPLETQSGCPWLHLYPISLHLMSQNSTIHYQVATSALKCHRHFLLILLHIL